MKHLTPITAIAFVAATTAVAENELTPRDAPAERPYPFEILGLQPGDAFDDVLVVYSERTDALGILTHEETTTFDGRERTTISEYELCGIGRHYRNRVDYRFEYPRD